MAVATSLRNFLTNTLIPTYHPKKKPAHPLLSVSVTCSSSSNDEDNGSSNFSGNNTRLAKLAIVTLAGGMLTMGPVHDAMAAKTGGRVGGQAFRSAAPRASSPRINNSRTNIYVNPPVAPPLIGGYGYGSPFYGGWGWSPFSFFAPGPSVAVGVGGFDFFTLFLVLGAVATVIRRFRGPRDEDGDY